ncbi:aldehyde dehydrogenase [Neptunomonas sp. XY-337]|uniref:aldehyde dehydrogenase n=1 Tax=Neptunomonas sp. XY-337 TaxID=2561897 RepID=UPI0010AAFAC1|nr:aldehyde dehydrogenase [Neptunomonas sp. XY-337]
MKSYQEWEALRSELRFREGAFINGEFVPAISGETFPSVNPATEEVLVNVASCDTADIDVAVSHARAAFQSGVWSQMAPRARKKVLLRLAQLLDQHRDELALLDTLEMGKSISEMVAIDIPDTIDCFEWTAECIDKVYGEIAPTGVDTLALISHEPCGVVGCITPWNYPLMMAAWKVAPALAAGNSVILKPSEKSVLSLLRLAELAKEAGIPDGVFNVVTGYGHTAGKALALHQDVDVLAFTGSTRVAGMLMGYAGESNMKRVWLEAGGKSPNLVFADADLDKAAQTAAVAIFGNQGEVCIACSRLYVDASVKDEFVEKLVAAAKRFQPGDPLNPATTMGPLVDKAQLDTVARYVNSAIEEGGRVLLGGVPEHQTGEGFFVEPTIIDNAHNGMTFVKEEIFGPVLAVCTFETEEEAIRLANDSQYGLGSALWTESLSRAHRVSRQIQAGMVWVNTWGEGDTTVPFGGVKASGNGRDKSLHAFEKYTDVKNVMIRLS